MNKHIRRGRSHRALLISLIVHLCLAMTVTVVIYRESLKAFEDAIGIEFVDEEKLAEPRRKIKPPSPKRLTLPQTARSSVEGQPQTVRLRLSANPINETVLPSVNPLLYSAIDDKLNIADPLPDVTTAAKIASHRGTTIPEQVATRYQTTDGDGVKSTRQRVAGDGSDGLHAIESTGVSDVGIVGSSSKKPGTGPGGSVTSDKPFAKALRKIADHIIATREKDKVDIVFVLDTSKSMLDNIQQIAANLYTMTDAYDEINLKYFIGMSEFNVSNEVQQLEMWPLTPDVGVLRRRMQEVRLSGDEFVLDALIETLNYMEFHPEADKHLVLVTDEPASTSFRKAKAVTEMQKKVISNCQSEEVHVNVLGHTEVFQKRLAKDTGGLWLEIPGGLVQNGSLLLSQTTDTFPRATNEKFLQYFRDIVANIHHTSRWVMFDMDVKYTKDLDDKGNLISNPIMRAFKNSGNPLSAKASIAIQAEGKQWLIVDGNRTYTAMRVDDKIKFYRSGSAEAYGSKVIADIVIMLDYSRSMGGKSEVVMLGLSELIGKLDILPIKYELRLIRFAVAKDAIKSIDGTQVTPIPLNEEQIRNLMGEPFGGDEHLIDAIVEGLPKISFRPNATRVLLVLTDEPTTGNLAPEQALEVCQSLGIRAYVIGVNSPKSMFQSTLAKQTHGLFFLMPNGFSKTYPYQ